MHVQSCCFACLNLLPFCRSRCRRRHRCLNSLIWWMWRHVKTLYNFRLNGPFAWWRHFTIKTWILFVLSFIFLNFVLPVRFKQQKPLFVQESKAPKDSGRRSKMTSSCKWPIVTTFLTERRLGRNLASFPLLTMWNFKNIRVIIRIIIPFLKAVILDNILVVIGN